MERTIFYLHTENFKTPMKDLKKKYKWQGSTCSRIRINIVKMAKLPTVVSRFIAVPVKIPMSKQISSEMHMKPLPKDLK